MESIPIHQANEPQYNIVEIFHSLQGEGYNTGLPCIFVRFGKCNLACPWCDTPYNDYFNLSMSELLKQIECFDCKNIIITGGEPTIQPKLQYLLDKLKSRGYFLAIESNGLKEIPSQIDYIALSPKAMYQHKYQRHVISHADEIRIVNDGDILDFCLHIEQLISASHYYLSPCERDGEMNILDTIEKLGELNQRVVGKHWQLSLQTHKLANIE